MKQQISILGAAESGVGAAILAKAKGFKPFVSDFGIIKNKYKDILEEHQIEYEEKNHNIERILNSIEIIKSPGIPDSVPVIQECKKNKTPVISEIEFASRYTDAIKICITGSNGKTTTTELIYHTLKNADLNVGIAGNVGKSFAWQVAENRYDYYVIELSSFQLDNMYDFKADIAILLNITPDHLDRYENNFQNYISSKFRIIRNQNKFDSFIYNNDDETLKKVLSSLKLKQKIFPFSIKNQLTKGASIKNNHMIIKLDNNEFIISSENFSLEGQHNQYNSLAAGIAAKLSGVRNEVIKESFSTFKGVEHRLERFQSIRGVHFINDSKATNINSVWYALESMKTPVILILGGVDKGNDYNEIRQLVKDKVKAIVAIGIDNKPILDYFSDFKEVFDTNNIDDAVKTAYFLAEKGDTVLLSPACASFDLFENYKDRGLKFKEAVRKL